MWDFECWKLARVQNILHPIAVELHQREVGVVKTQSVQHLLLVGGGVGVLVTAENLVKHNKFLCIVIYYMT